jgi:hypothetical protein
VEFESNYPREARTKDSQRLRIYERAYLFATLAALAGMMQLVAIVLALDPGVTKWVLGGIGYVAYYAFAVKTALEMAKLEEYNRVKVVLLAISSGSLYCFSPLICFLVFGVWLSVVIWKMGVKVTLRHWTGFDFKGRISELEAEGK